MPKHFLSKAQCSELQFCAECLEPSEFLLWDENDWKRLRAQNRSTGVYAFLRSNSIPRIYIGSSEYFPERAIKQRYQRRWAGELVYFEMAGYLRTNTLRSLESSILCRGAERLSWVLWDNETGLSPRNFETVWDTNPDLDHLIEQILGHIRVRIPKGKGFGVSDKLNPTHVFGEPSGRVYGLAHRRRNGWIYLLRGSRITSDYPNFRAVKKNQKAHALLSKYYYEGCFVWRPWSLGRPAGFVVMEPIMFRSAESAARFLMAGGAVSERWRAVWQRPEHISAARCARGISVFH